MIRKIERIAAFLLATILLCTVCAQAEAHGADTAELVVIGSMFTATDDTAEAFAVKDGRYVYVGSADGVQSLIGEDTTVLEYADGFVMPGAVDGHSHYYVKAECRACDVQVNISMTKEEMFDALRQYAQEHPEDQFIRAYGWVDAMFGTEIPTAAMLDEIFPDVPVYFKSEDCHSCWVNTRMLELTGVNAETADPIGGVIERYENGEPNGCFRDTAMNKFVDTKLPLYSVEEYKQMLLGQQSELLAKGYTAFNDVIIDVPVIENVCRAYSELDREGTLRMKVNLTVICENSDDYADQITRISRLAEELNGENFRIDAVKFFMDGITESRTAYVLEAYEGTGGTGVCRWPGEEGTERLKEAVKLCNDMGLVAHFHAIGDAAVRLSLDAIAYAKETSANKDIRNCITHLQLVAPEDIQRMAELDVIAVEDLGWCAMSGDDDVDIARLGRERTLSMYPYRSILEAGVRCSYATDCPAGPINDVTYNVSVGVSRMMAGATSTLRNAEECMSVEDALKMVCAGGAYQLGREEEIGTIEVGKSADFMILSADPMTVPAEEIMLCRPVATYIDGECLYSAE